MAETTPLLASKPSERSSSTGGVLGPEANRKLWEEFDGKGSVPSPESHVDAAVRDAIHSPEDAHWPVSSVVSSTFGTEGAVSSGIRNLGNQSLRQERQSESFGGLMQLARDLGEAQAKGDKARATELEERWVEMQTNYENTYLEAAKTEIDALMSEFIAKYEEAMNEMARAIDEAKQEAHTATGAAQEASSRVDTVAKTVEEVRAEMRAKANEAREELGLSTSGEAAVEQPDMHDVGGETSRGPDTPMSVPEWLSEALGVEPVVADDITPDFNASPDSYTDAEMKSRSKRNRLKRIGASILRTVGIINIAAGLFGLTGGGSAHAAEAPDLGDGVTITQVADHEQGDEELPGPGILPPPDPTDTGDNGEPAATEGHDDDTGNNEEPVSTEAPTAVNTDEPTTPNHPPAADADGGIRPASVNAPVAANTDGTASDDEGRNWAVDPGDQPGADTVDDKTGCVPGSGEDGGCIPPPDEPPPPPPDEPTPSGELAQTGGDNTAVGLGMTVGGAGMYLKGGQVQRRAGGRSLLNRVLRRRGNE